MYLCYFFIFYSSFPIEVGENGVGIERDDFITGGGGSRTDNVQRAMKLFTQELSGFMCSLSRRSDRPGRFTALKLRCMLVETSLALTAMRRGALLV